MPSFPKGKTNWYTLLTPTIFEADALYKRYEGIRSALCVTM